MINTRLVFSSVITSAILSLILLLYPSIDIMISGLFYSNDADFIYRNNEIALFIFKTIPLFTKLFFFFCFILLIYFLITDRVGKKHLISGVLFLMITAIIAPGIVVNSGLKDNFGRARPSQIKEFGGVKKFSPAFIPSNQCQTNCSFSSGHAAMGFYFTAIAYIVGSAYFTRVYLLGLFFGLIVGISRIIMGGHFTSDVTSSALIVLGLNHLIYVIWQRYREKH